MTTARVFFVKIISIPAEELFPKRKSGAPLHTLSKLGTNCTPLLADICLYSYEADFIHSLLSTGKKPLASRFKSHLQVHR